MVQGHCAAHDANGGEKPKLVQLTALAVATVFSVRESRDEVSKPRLP